MTLEHGTGGTALVSSAAADSAASGGAASSARASSSASAAASSSIKHSLRSSSAAKAKEEADEAAEETLLVKEEEKLMLVAPSGDEIVEDEEVTSEEEEPDAEATERAMLTVALVKSVVETRGSAGGGGTSGESSGGSGKRVINSVAPDLATVSAVAASGGSDSGPSSPGSHAYGLRKRRRPSGQDLERLEHFQSTKDGGLARIVKQDQPPAGAAAATTGASIHTAATSISRSSTDTDTDTAPTPTPTPAAAPPLPPQAPPKTRKTGRPPKAAAAVSFSKQPSIPLLSGSSAVPNPLSGKIDSPMTAPLHPGSLLLDAVEPCRLSDKAATDTAAASSSNPEPAVAQAPLSEASTGLVTSAPADPSSEKRKVTINEPEFSSRKRGFSVDLDFFELGDDNSTLPTGGVGGGRDRAFSFECFAFGINADEPLPPLDHHNGVSIAAAGLDHHGRPRGDSIIFDPSSFQDGGIHEQTALEKHPGTDERADAGGGGAGRARSTSAASVPSELGLPSLESKLLASARGDDPARFDSSVARGPDAIAVNGAEPASPGATANVSLDLVNKDGRIGIYLPEARRARIARFHAKRSRRIWRKRIKYDCRKKLADSRPRIKGRFVKRTDMED